MGDAPHHSLSITVITDSHASVETWHIIGEMAAVLRAEFGEPIARQLVPLDAAEAFADDPRSVVL